jgi:AcrR family transcriptional regulator
MVKHAAPAAGVTALAAPKAPKRRLDPEQTRQDILEAASAEFAEHGLAGARVDAIAARTRTTKRMIYYYFTSKEGLYLAVLERAYAGIRSIEAQLALERLSPEAAIRRMIEFTFDYQEAHPDFIRLVSIENIHHARYLAQSQRIRALNETVIDGLAALLARGHTAGAFRADLSAVDVHLMISSFCFFRVANRHTFGALFAIDLAAPATREAHKRMIVEAVLRLLRPGAAG